MCALMTTEWGGWVAAGVGGLLLFLVLLSIAALLKYLIGSRPGAAFDQVERS